MEESQPLSQDTRPWIAAFCLLSILLVILLWYPVSRLNARYALGVNEGFSTNYQAVAANGGKVYGAPPVYAFANYPPLSFHLVGWLGRVTGDINVAGRWLSFLSYLAIGALIGMIVLRLNGSRRISAYSALCWLIWIPAFDVGRIGLNDPHLLGVAISLAGLYCYVRDPESTRWLAISAVVFSLSLFTKQSLISFPAAVAIQLFLTSKRRLGIWFGVAVSTCVVLLMLTFAVDGKYFFEHLDIPRAYYVADVWASLLTYYSFIQVAFCVALVRVLRGSFLVWGFVIAHLIGAFYCGGAGAGVNHLFDALVFTAILAALAIPGMQRMVRDTAHPTAWFAVLLVVPFFLSSFVVLTHRIPADLAHPANEIAQAEAEFSSLAAFVKAQPGPALCENLLLCYAAGKPEVYDPFAVDMMMRTGKMSPDQVAQLVESRQFGVIQIDWTAAEPLQAAPRMRFPGPFMRALLTRYQVAQRTARYAVFVPRQ
jgi:hypothetical protein